MTILLYVNRYYIHQEICMSIDMVHTYLCQPHGKQMCPLDHTHLLKLQFFWDEHRLYSIVLCICFGFVKYRAQYYECYFGIGHCILRSLFSLVALPHFSLSIPLQRTYQSVFCPTWVHTGVLVVGREGEGSCQWCSGVLGPFTAILGQLCHISMQEFEEVVLLGCAVLEIPWLPWQCSEVSRTSSCDAEDAPWKEHMPSGNTIFNLITVMASVIIDKHHLPLSGLFHLVEYPSGPSL